MATETTKKAQISKEQIVDEALALLRETSLSALTMRMLADRLGIKAASLYWHFRSKGALETAMSQRLFIKNTVEVPDADSLPEWMRNAGRHIFRNLMAYPDSGMLIRRAALSDEQFQATIEIVRRKLAKFPVDQERAFGLYGGIEALISGWVTFAQSPSGPGIEAAFDLEKTAFETLDALVAGWNMEPEGKPA